MDEIDPFDFDAAAIERATNQAPIPFQLPTLTPKLRNQLVFWLGICPAAIGGLAWMAVNRSTEQPQSIVTAAAPQAQQLDLQQSVTAVVDGMVNGQQIGGEQLIRAATTVLNWQESEATQQLANQIAINARIERGTKKALCYRIPEKQCLDKRKQIVETSYDKAIDAGNQGEVLKIQATLKALDRLLDGDTAPSAFDPNIYRLARVRRGEGQSQARAVSAGGRAAQQIQIQQGLERNGSVKVGKVGE
jgi:hypothetical protein